MASSSIAAAVRNGVIRNRNKFTWQQTMLRVSNADASLRFYRDVLGMTHIDTLRFDEYGFTLFFLESQNAVARQAWEEKVGASGGPGSDAAHAYLWSMSGVALELTYNHHDSDEVYHPGNEPGDGFGHIAFACEDVVASSERLEKEHGVSFKKRPHEGRMKSIAFAYDPDKYWVEIVSRGTPAAASPSAPLPALPEFVLAQTMVRVKDPAKAIPFYTEQMGMTKILGKNFGSFTNYFLASLDAGGSERAGMPVLPMDAIPDPEDADAAGSFIKNELYPRCIPVLELTFNHGTETDDAFAHTNGNEAGKRGFGHIGFLTQDVYESCRELEKEGVDFKKKPDDGTMKGLAFAYDPDGYWVEIIKRDQ